MHNPLRRQGGRGQHQAATAEHLLAPARVGEGDQPGQQGRFAAAGRAGHHPGTATGVGLPQPGHQLRQGPLPAREIPTAASAFHAAGLGEPVLLKGARLQLPQVGGLGFQVEAGAELGDVVGIGEDLALPGQVQAGVPGHLGAQAPIHLRDQAADLQVGLRLAGQPLVPLLHLLEHRLQGRHKHPFMGDLLTAGRGDHHQFRITVPGGGGQLGGQAGDVGHVPSPMAEVEQDQHLGCLGILDQLAGQVIGGDGAVIEVAGLAIAGEQVEALPVFLAMAAEIRHLHIARLGALPQVLAALQQGGVVQVEGRGLGPIAHLPKQPADCFKFPRHPFQINDPLPKDAVARRQQPAPARFRVQRQRHRPPPGCTGSAWHRGPGRRSPPAGRPRPARSGL